MIRTAVLISAVLVALAAPARALAASKPSVTTGSASSVAQQTATLNGSVNPNGAATTYFFQYGPTIVYGAQSVAAAAGAGTKSVSVSAAIGGLAPATKYHYRLVAQNVKGTTVGADRTFTTKRQPLGVTLAATPNPVPFGRGTTLAGTLTGTGNANRVVQLQANPFPYTQGFQPVGNSQLTNAQGGFSFLLPPVAINTQFRVLMPEKPTVVSPIVSVGVAVRVSTHVHRSHRGSGLLVRFSGTVRPARDGAQFAIQKRHGSKWVTINGGITHHASSGSFSRYSKRIRLHHGGTFRVFVGIVDGNFVSNVGRSVHIRVR
jgi:hypothetical protein